MDLVTWDPNASHSAVSASSASTAQRRTNQSPAQGPPLGTSSAASSESLPSTRLDYAPKPPNATNRVKPSESVADEEVPASPPDLYPFLSKFLYRAEVTQADLWLKDLELLHQWTIETYFTLSQRDDIQHLWKVDAPRHAIKHPFLMHEMLAFAAFHKAYQQPREERQEYFVFGIHHQDNVIRGVREVLQNITPDNAPAIVATSTLLTLSVFASTGLEADINPNDNSQSTIESILNCFHLMQGMGSVLALTRGTVMDSFVAPMIRRPTQPIPSQPMLQELVNQLPTLVTFINEKSDLPEGERKLLLEVIGHMEPVLQLAMQALIDNRELRFLFIWPLHLTPEYTNLIRQNHPGALSILMFYTTMIYAAEPRFWFMEGWGGRLMKACYELMDQSWMPCLRWPMSFLPQEIATNWGFSGPRQSPGRTPWALGPLLELAHGQPPPAGSSTSHEGYSSSPHYESPGDHKTTISTTEASASRPATAQTDQTQV
ncbi:fungal zn binuclear cluster domain-containing [Pyrenophora seminiperda CCB06]|uniref:Fungal zn binuclear cluster domain-containing n=1 Tax=Pyrenophora seminiperda CCB06 TaxID=1302712 RepID=A0A3M7M9E1_9PLEO|nr:fungal zn binuclear cluster domain-containing [Pyrenophora seminiperda CCB06]